MVYRGTGKTCMERRIPSLCPRCPAEIMLTHTDSGYRDTPAEKVSSDAGYSFRQSADTPMEKDARCWRGTFQQLTYFKQRTHCFLKLFDHFLFRNSGSPRTIVYTKGAYMSRYLMLAHIISACFIFITCDPEQTVGPRQPYTVPQSVILSESYTMSMSGDTLFVIIPQCVKSNDTWITKASIHTAIYALSDDDSKLDLNLSHPTHTTASGERICVTLQFSRDKGWSEIYGVWKYDLAQYDVGTDGTPDDTVNAILMVQNYLAMGFEYLEIRENIFSIYSEIESTITFYDLFTDEFSALFSASPNITIETVKDSAGSSVDSIIRLTGNTTGEIVLISLSASGSITTRSSREDHQAHTYVAYSVICPNPKYPNWLSEDFFSENINNS